MEHLAMLASVLKQTAHHRLMGARQEWRRRRWLFSTLSVAPFIAQDHEGFRFVVYPWDRSKLPDILTRRTDRAQLAAMPLLLPTGGTAFDVGAHVGRFSVALARLVGPTGRVFAFEPVPETYWILRENLALNGCSNVTPVESAVCDRVEPVMMNLFDRAHTSWNTMGWPSMPNPAGARIRPSNSITVNGETIDRFCGNHGIARIDFLKVDTEGFELVVFRGAGRMLREKRIDYICFEISRDPLQGAGISAREVFEALCDLGYHSYEFDEQEGRFRGPIRDSCAYWANYYASWMDLSNLTAEEDR